MGKTSIEWTDYTFNPWRGCEKVSPGCANCYAETLSKRNPKTLGVWGPHGSRVVASEAMWLAPELWNREAMSAGQRRRVFCASLADVFEDWQEPMVESKGRTLFTDSLGKFGVKPTSGGRFTTMGDVRERLLQLAHDLHWLDWLFLTKRPANVETMLAKAQHQRFPHCDFWKIQQRTPRPNWWLGTSVENQACADERIPQLMETPAAVRFLSCEPLLGPLDLSRWLENEVSFAIEGRAGGVPDCAEYVVTPPRIGWVIVGGESGPHARPMHPNWVRSIRDQCQAAGVPFFFKQWGEWVDLSQSPHCAEERDRGFNPGFCPIGRDGEPVFAPAADRERGDVTVYKFGKKAAGRLLDGREWSEFPTGEALR